MTSFTEIGLAAPILRALADANYATPTPIQSAAIPVIRSGRDLIGIAQTGTGKTAAFALPILHHLFAMPAAHEPKSCRILVLTPTRELANQIGESFRTYGRHLRVRTTQAIGGVPIARQVRALSGGVDVLIATPGRLLDLLRARAVRLDRVQILVLDEADRMLDMGFIQDVRTILAKLPHTRQTLLFSATMPREITDLATHFLRDPASVSVTPPAATADRVAQQIVHVDRAHKPRLLEQTLRGGGIDRALVFARTKHGADKIRRGLANGGIDSDVIHGNKSQGQRERALAAFRDGSIRVLIATDIAARGIDVAGISHVINYDLPNVPETYVHRIGRTARAGAEGIAVSFCSSDEVPFLRAIEKTIRMTIPATGEQVPEARAHTTRGPRDAAHSRRGAPAGGPAGDGKPQGRRPRRRRRRELPTQARSPSEPAHGHPLSAVPFLQTGGRAPAFGDPMTEHPRLGADLG